MPPCSPATLRGQCAVLPSSPSVRDRAARLAQRELASPRTHVPQSLESIRVNRNAQLQRERAAVLDAQANLHAFRQREFKERHSSWKENSETAGNQPPQEDHYEKEIKQMQSIITEREDKIASMQGQMKELVHEKTRTEFELFTRLDEQVRTEKVADFLAHSW
jgi:biotin carboxylase